MPTGYTADVQDGKVTKFSEFALCCARAFGALISMRDDPMDAPLPTKIEPSSYNEKAVEAAIVKLATLRSMTPAKAEKKAAKAHAKLLAAHEAYEAEKKLRRERYEAMLAKVREWTPPTKDHIGLKTFMKEQLAESIKFDCGPPSSAPKAQSGADWLAEELERAANRTKWLQQLRKSLAA